MKKLVGKLILWMMGWKKSGEFPDFKKYVIIAGPHTSNWDGLLMLSFAAVYDLPIKWMVKDSLIKGPMGWFLKMMGAVPINRRSSHNVVEQMAKRFEDTDSLFLAVPPEGTRGYRDYWKSGFYFIAKEANVPIVMSFLDYSKKEGGVGGYLIPSDDLKADMDKLRAFYGTKQGLYPKKVSRIRLRAEDELEAETQTSKEAQAPESKDEARQLENAA